MQTQPRPPLRLGYYLVIRRSFANQVRTLTGRPDARLASVRGLTLAMIEQGHYLGQYTEAGHTRRAYEAVHRKYGREPAHYRITVGMGGGTAPDGVTPIAFALDFRSIEPSRN